VTYGSHEGQEWAQVSVCNDGPVMNPDHLEELFEPFERGSHTRRGSSASVQAGLGLGLAIVRAVALAHDGHAHATARPGGGLTVIIRIPRLPEQHNPRAAR
jgi:signal transduction histidine kinase